MHKCLHISKKSSNFVADYEKSALMREGEMLEWLKRHAWKACKLQKGFRGSNPRLSAKILRRAGEVSLLTDTAMAKSFEQGASGSLWVIRGNCAARRSPNPR